MLTASATPAPAAPDNDRGSVQVIARAASILRALETAPDGLSLGQIATRVGLARSTVQRIAGALEAEQMLAPVSPRGGVRLGPSLLRMAGAVRIDVIATIRPLMQQLAAELGETVDFAVLDGNRLVFQDQVVGVHRLRTVSAVGEAFALHCTANGKAVLAEMDDRAIARLIGRRYRSLTQHSHTRLATLLDDIADIRKTGVAIDREEHTLGICAAGIAVRRPSGQLVAMSVPVPTARFMSSESRITDAVRKIHGKLRAALSVD